jgi:hypothetical protein
VLPCWSDTAESYLHAVVKCGMALQSGSPCVLPAPPQLDMYTKCVQVTKYVQREILNHRRLIHPHIVEMREVTVSQAVMRPSEAPRSCDVFAVAAPYGMHDQPATPEAPLSQQVGFRFRRCS